MDIEQLFLRFAARYQRTWTSLFPTPESYAVAVNEWALILDSVDAAGIERALRRCLREFASYPPKPAEFLALTRPTAQELGLLSLEDAFQAALERRWRLHPLVWHVVTTIGQYEFGLLPRDESFRRFQEVYEHLVELVANKRRIDPAFELQIPKTAALQLGQNPSRHITAPGEARAHLAAIRERLKQPDNS